MSRRYGHPAQRQKANYNWTPSNDSYNHGQKKDWTDINNRLDDQIAPQHTSQSIYCLQRWALATANFPQEGHHHKEVQIIDRIRRRYESPLPNPHDPFPRHSNVVTHAQDRNSTPELYEQVRKRQRTISPPQTGRTPREGLSAVAYMREAKRRRSRSPSLPRSVPKGHGDSEQSAVDLTEKEEDDYTQSSEWSFPASDNGREIIDLT